MNEREKERNLCKSCFSTEAPQTRYAIFVWKEGESATWIFTDLEHLALESAQWYVEEGSHYTNAKVFEMRFIQSFEDKDKFSSQVKKHKVYDKKIPDFDR